MTTHIYVGLTVIGAFLLAGCDGRHRGQSDAGPVRAETREVGAFDSVDMTGAARLEITIGPKESLVVEARDAALKRLETEVHGNTLRVRTKRARDWVWGGDRPRLTVRITLPKLDSLEVSGGNDVHLMGFAGGKSRIKVEGATNLHAGGQLDELTISMAGAGHADLSDLVANNAYVTVAGVGSVFVHPRDSLEATMNGVGAILYTGSPREVNTHMNGLGTIGRGDPKEVKRGDDDEKVERDADKKADADDLQPERDPKTDAIKEIRKMPATETI
jgi:hypothetical protein